MWTQYSVGLVLLFLAGCGFPAAKVEEAKGYVQRSLEAWQAGEKPESLKAQSPAIEFFELMWTNGEKLVKYEMGSARYAESAQAVRVEVKLTLRKGKGKERTESIVYDVTLGPPVKVVNNIMP